MRYPVEVKTDQDKLEFTLRAKEILRLEHNVMGDKFRNGEISELEWKAYWDNDFFPKNQIIAIANGTVNKVLGLTTRETIEPNRPMLDSFKTSERFKINLNDI